MNWLTNYVRPKVRAALEKRKETPENLWFKCQGCGQMVFQKEFCRNHSVCTTCGYHGRICPTERLGMLFDDGVYQTLPQPKVVEDPLKFKDQRKYTERLKAARMATGDQDALIVASGKLGGECAVIGVQADIGEQDAERLVRDIGVAGIDFFARCADDGALDLPAPIHRRVHGISGRMRPIRLPDDAVVEVADRVAIDPDLMRRDGKLVPSRILRDTDGRRQEIEFAQDTLLHRLVGALDGRRSVREVVAAVNRGEAPDEKVALLIGALVDGGLLTATRVPATAGAV